MNDEPDPREEDEPIKNPRVLGTMYLRVPGYGDPFKLTRFGPKQPDHPTIGGACLACGSPFTAGDHTTLVALGPGDDEDERQKAYANRAYTAVAVELHYACATGDR